VAFDVSVSDIVARWRVLDADETSVATVRLADAQMKLRIDRPSLEASWTALPVSTAAEIARKADVTTAIRVALTEAVIRFLRNPDVTTNQQISSDGSVGVSYDTRADSGIYINEDDLYAIDGALALADEIPIPRRVRSQVLATTFPWRSASDITSLPTP
jgi:hypothetical protein